MSSNFLLLTWPPLIMPATVMALSECSVHSYVHNNDLLDLKPV